MENNNFSDLKQKFISSRKLENDNDEDVYEECFKITNKQVDKNLFPILFYSLYDKAETSDYTNSMVKVICKFISTNNSLWVAEDVINSAETIYPHTKISYSIIFNFIIETKPEQCLHVISEIPKKVYDKILDILEFIINSGKDYGLNFEYAIHFKEKVPPFA